MTQKEQTQELLKKVHPTLDVVDEEALFGQINKDYEEYANLISDYEEDIAKAAAEGEVRGRNARIEQLSVAPATDGVPYLGGANIDAEPSHGGSIFDIARGSY